MNNEAAQPVPLLLTQRVSDRGVLPHLGFWHSFFGGDTPEQVLGAGAGAEVWEALEKWEWARLYLHFTHITHGLSWGQPWGQFLGPGDNSLSLGDVPAGGQLSQLAGAQVWLRTLLDPQIFGFAKSLRRAGSGSGCRRSEVVPCVCVCVHIYKYKYREKRYCRGSLLLLLLFGTCRGWGAG